MSEGTDCERCWADREDAIHAIKDCRRAKEVWEMLVPPAIAMEFSTWN